MLVSLAVLTVALSIVGVVFGVTTRAAGQSAAYAEVQGYLRQFAAQFEADLRGIDPGRSILVMTGRKQALALTQDDLDARRFYRIAVGDPETMNPGFDPAYTPGDPNSLSAGVYQNPRADLLTFFTNRAVPSIAPSLNPTDSLSIAAASGASLAPVLVTYGHAAIGQAVWNGSQWVFPNDADLRHIQQTIGSALDDLELSALPGTRWHLARRQVIIDPNANPNQLTFDTTYDTNVFPRIVRAQPDLPSGRPGDVARLNLSEFFRDLGPSPGIGAGSRAALLIPYGFDRPAGGGGGGAGAPGFPGWIGDAIGAPLRSRIEQLLYPPLTYPAGSAAALRHFATIIENPPADLRSNMGMQLLPGCVEFKVEFLMPEDARYSSRYIGYLGSVLKTAQTSDVPRWATVRPGETYAFVPDSPENRSVIISQALDGIAAYERINGFSRLDAPPPGNVVTWHQRPAQPPGGQLPDPALVDDAIRNRAIRLWPYAIRVTVRAIDGRGRLPEPVTRSFVHRFPE
jgi:hypothetical protein